MTSRPLQILKTASLAARALPLTALNPLAERAGASVGPKLMADKASMLDRHLSRIQHDGNGQAVSASDGFGSYARYWVDLFRLPSLSETQIDRGFSFVGYEHIEAARAAGFGPILLLPHLGSWEWAAAWLGRIANVPVTAVVERLDPADVFEWFTEVRASWGVDVVPLGAEAFGRLAKAAKDGSIICLLADRDVGGTGIEVEFFGEKTSLPVGPAVLSSRTGSPLIPTAVYFSGHQRICRVGEPIWPDDVQLSASGRSLGQRRRPRDRYQALTQRFVHQLEVLIAEAPEQWHLLEPNWPSDHNGR